MKLIDKLLLGLMCVLNVLIGMALLLFAVAPYRRTRFESILENSPWGALAVCALALILIALAVRVMIVLIRGDAMGKKSVSIQKSETGTSFMTVGALNAMVARFIRTDNRVIGAKTSVKSNGDAVSIMARISAKADAVIPEMTEQLQNSIKSHIETYSGAKVDKVEVIIESTAEKPAAEGRVA